MAKSPGISEQDSALFRAAVKDTIPLKRDTFTPPTPRPAPQPVKTQADNQAVLQEMEAGELNHAMLECGDELLYYRPGFQKQAFRKLRQGKFKIEAELDLHGMTAETAKQELTAFLRYCGARNQRCARVIHGKGHGSKNRQPVIKNKLNHWLRQRNDVLAFCSARPMDGGTGAIYLLLRKHA